MVNLKEIAFSNIFLKVNSFIIAFLLWSTLCNMITIKKWIEIPLVFFNTDNNIKINAPKKITIQIAGKKEIVDNASNNISVNIDAKLLSLGDNPYILTSENLYFPPSINLIDYIPRTLIINTQKIG